jgi:hypothetical protein
LKTTQKIISFLLLASEILFLSCAKQGFPPGGPEDRTPPSVVRTIPSPNQTGVDPRIQVTIRFSEAVKSKASSDAVFISPYQGDNVKFKWRGGRLNILFLKPLREKCTYVVTLGTGIQDYRNNSLASSYTLAFSTGDVLDEGEMSGRVYSASTGTGLDVWAYKCNGTTDPDPTQREPDYIVQCDEKGTFRFSNVEPVRYRLFAVRDRASDRIYQPGEDEIGVPCRDAMPSPDGTLKADSCFFKMIREETGPPSLIKVTARDRNHLALRFDRMLVSLVLPSTYSCGIARSDLPSDSLGVKALFLDRNNPRELSVITEDQSGDVPYSLSLRTDWIENHPDSLFWNRSFKGNGEPDTVKPKLANVVPKPKERMFVPLDPVRLTFSEAMDTVAFSAGFVLTDTSGHAVPGSLRWVDPTEVRFAPAKPLRNYYYYVLRLTGQRDAAGNALPDTAVQFHTSTIDTLSEIIGMVRQADSTGKGDYCITATQVGGMDVAYFQKRTSPGSYRISDCLPGKYILDCYRDSDGNGKYSYGKPFPFKPSEPFVVYSDTVKVRSRWPNEGNNIVLP